MNWFFNLSVYRIFVRLSTWGLRESSFSLSTHLLYFFFPFCFPVCPYKSVCHSSYIWFPYLLLIYFWNYFWIVSGQEDPPLSNRLSQLQLFVEFIHFLHVHTEVNVNCLSYQLVRPSNLQAEMWGSEIASMYRENSVRFEENSEDGSTKRNTRSQIT